MYTTAETLRNKWSRSDGAGRAQVVSWIRDKVIDLETDAVKTTAQSREVRDKDSYKCFQWISKLSFVRWFQQKFRAWPSSPQIAAADAIPHAHEEDGHDRETELAHQSVPLTAAAVNTSAEM